MTSNDPREVNDAVQGDEAGGPPIGSAWTLVVESEDGWSADLEHAAPLPRAGERIEFIGGDGRRRQLRVTEVVHIVQTAADERPLVRDEQSGPNSFVTDGADDDPPRSLRAGLPRVVAEPMEEP
jgi:hypothetical protein